MPYQITWEPHGVCVRYTGPSSGEEVARFATEAQADSRFDDIRYALHDFTACTGAVFSQPTIEMLAATDAAASVTNRRVRVAVVTDRDDVKAMVDAYLKVGLHPYPLRIFAGVEEARRWLNGAL